MMYKLSDIRQLHLEISSECNAICPRCPRNLSGYQYNDGYPEHSMTLAEAQKIFSPSFIHQLNKILINGNFGDIVMCDDAIPILRYFKQHTNENVIINISTNGGARNSEFWIDLAKLNVVVYFCLDGLEDTHSIYRRNTVYSTVIKNAQTFIAAGGRAVWKMIDFDHNQHQQEEAKKLSEQLGFTKFQLIRQKRNFGPVFNQEKKLEFMMKTSELTSFDLVYELHARPDAVANVAGCNIPIKSPITCEAIETKGIYVNSVGEVYPCCYIGFSPMTYGHGSGNYFNVINTQLRPLISNFNALEHSLEECLEWFSRVEETWNLPDYASGRLVACNSVCGGRGT